MIVYIIKSPHTSEEWMLLREEGETDENRKRTMEGIDSEARVQLLPQGNVDPSGDPLLAGCRKKIAMALHCKRCHELKMSSSYSSGLN